MPQETSSRIYARRIARTLLVAFVGIALLHAFARQPAPEEVALMPSVARPIPLDATTSPASVLPAWSALLPHRGVGKATVWREDDGQSARACWLANVGGAPFSCVYSAGTIETLLTPDYMRALLTTWRDAGSLTTSELQGRLREVDAACGPQGAAP